MKILALIPARGGSKRLPGKNIKVLGDMPLIAWSIKAAQGISDICDVLVSTDDNAIADVAKLYGALVPWLRPSKFATDEAHVVDVALHALDWYEAKRGVCDGILLLQPTSPFRTSQTIHQGIQLFRKHEMRAVVGVSKAHSHPLWAMKIEDGDLKPFMDEHGLGCRSQDLTPAYVVNGSFYLVTPSHLRLERSLFPKKMLPLMLDSPQEALDIDTRRDWNLAEYWLDKCCDEVFME
jgi:CMP-N,N'-diacetyllegionaminic acid synthase